MPSAGRRNPLPRRLARAMWSAAAFFGAGYLPTILLGNPVIAMGLATGLMIPFGSRAATPVRGALWGAALGCLAGLAMFGAVMVRLQPVPAGPAGAATRAPAPATAAATSPATAPAWPPLSLEEMRRIRAICVLGTGAMCAAVGTVFACFARRRRRRIDREWARRG